MSKIRWEDHKNVSASCLQKYEGEDMCLRCDGLGWRFPRQETPSAKPTIDGVVFYQCQLCADCTGGATGIHSFRRLGWGGVI